MTNTMRLTAGFCALLILGACGDNGATDAVAPNAPPSAPEPTPASRLFFISGDTTLSAVNPADGSVSDAATGTKISGVATIQHADYDAARKHLSRLHHHTLVYANGAHLWKLSALSADSLSPTRLGAETIGVAGVCETFVAPDYANPQHSRYAYKFGGLDDDCKTAADNVWRLLRLDQGADAAPIVSTGNIEQPLTIVRDTNTGALTGWLRIIGTSLVRFDADFRHAVTVGTLPAASAQAIHLNDGRIALIADKSVTLYDPTSYPQPGTGLSAPIHTFAGSPGDLRSDGENLYAIEGRNIVRVPLATNAPATILTTIPADSSINRLTLTPTRLVYVSQQTINPSSPTPTYVTTLQSIPRSGGAPLTLVTAEPGQYITTSSQGLVAIGEWVYYIRGSGSPYDAASFVRTAGAIRADGTGLEEYKNAHWTGWQHADAAPLRAPKMPGRMLLFDSRTTPASIWGYDNAQRLPGPLGHAPDDTFRLYFTGHGSGSALLGRGENDANMTDVFYIDLQKRASLARLTDTAATQDKVVGGGCTIAREASSDTSLVLLLLVLGGAFVRRMVSRRQ